MRREGKQKESPAATGEAGGQRYPDDHDGAESSGAEPMEGWKVGGAASRRDES